jgi:DpnII restriction endonuclease
MKRYRQTLDELLANLTAVGASWRDAHAEEVIQRLTRLPVKPSYHRADLLPIFDLENTNRERFDSTLTLVRLFLDLSKDEFTAAMRDRLGKGLGIKKALQEPEEFFGALEALGLLECMAESVNRPLSWHDILVERLKGGRGSAIKGQTRGRSLEDFVESLVVRVFGETSYDARCQFLGATGTSSEKADFAIPAKTDPGILIEVKAYGATGSKQTDVLGDITRIVNEKRHDTHFLLVTDGITWRERTSDLARLVELQNVGRITRIYTQAMAEQLEEDLRELKREHGI